MGSCEYNLFFLITAIQFVITLLVKIYTSKKFSRRKNYLNKLLHLLLSLNLASPFEDWGIGRFTVREYQERQKLTNIEMAWSLSVNIIFSLTMMVPLWYTGYQIRSRHQLPKLVSGTKPKEDHS